ncbi:MASE1 domain-containing protein [Luteibacter sp. CQ10]|uniref:MASE1 domain-containing protein n=1 Tax=Luteibacter sp. CQ10 TaxID=2805821 RepID=UPI0034A21B29
MRGTSATQVSLGHHFAVAAAYAACYEVVRYFSFSHWMLTAGLRLACLLFAPRRFWPALVVGEALPLMEKAILCNPFGLAWGFATAVPFILLCMPVVSLVLRRMPLYEADGRLKMSTVLTATLGCAVITALRTDAALVTAYIGRPDGIQIWSAEAVPDFMACLLGNYLGALTLVPVALICHQHVTSYGLDPRRALRHPLMRDMLLFIPVLVACALAGRDTGPEDIREFARLTLVLPVVAAALRHGWQGGAVIGMLASVAMASTATVLLDPGMIRAQVVLSLVISGALVAGARIAHRALRAPETY